MAQAEGGGPPPRRGRTPLGALLYWSLVLTVWGLIFIVGFLAVFATDLPDTSKLYDVKRQPSITYLDRSGAVVAGECKHRSMTGQRHTLPDRNAATSGLGREARPQRMSRKFIRQSSQLRPLLHDQVDALVRKLAADSVETVNAPEQVSRVNLAYL